jgi:hypothetical protein
MLDMIANNLLDMWSSDHARELTVELVEDALQTLLSHRDKIGTIFAEVEDLTQD